MKNIVFTYALQYQKIPRNLVGIIYFFYINPKLFDYYSNEKMPILKKSHRKLFNDNNFLDLLLGDCINLESKFSHSINKDNLLILGFSKNFSIPFNLDEVYNDEIKLVQMIYDKYSKCDSKDLNSIYISLF